MQNRRQKEPFKKASYIRNVSISRGPLLQIIKTNDLLNVRGGYFQQYDYIVAIMNSYEFISAEECQGR